MGRETSYHGIDNTLFTQTGFSRDVDDNEYHFTFEDFIIKYSFGLLEQMRRMIETYNERYILEVEHKYNQLSESLLRSINKEFADSIYTIL